jgi:hypothetical protein
MRKILSHCYSTFRLYTKSATLIDRGSSVPVSSRNPAFYAKRIIKKLKGERTDPVTKECPIPDTVQYF